MLARVTAVAALMLAVAACGHRPGAAPAPESSTDRAVYAAVLDAIFTGKSPDTLLVAESTFVFRAVGNRAANRRVPFDTVPFALRARLAEVSQTPSSSRTLALPLPVRIITSAELSAIFRGGQ